MHQAHAGVLRSPVAHADIVSIDTAASRDAPGVLAVLTGDDLAARGLGCIGVLNPCDRMDGSPGFVRQRPLLAQGRVRFVGEPVAFIVAESLNQAKDAAELIHVEYEELPVLTSVEGDAPHGKRALEIRSEGKEERGFVRILEEEMHPAREAERCQSVASNRRGFKEASRPWRTPATCAGPPRR